MYKRLYIYLNNNNIACNFQFGFTEKYCTSHTLIYIRIKEKLDDGNIGCEVFVDLQKAFDTVDHQILFA